MKISKFIIVVKRTKTTKTIKKLPKLIKKVNLCILINNGRKEKRKIYAQA